MHIHTQTVSDFLIFLPQPPKQLFVQGNLVPFRGEWNFLAKVVSCYSVATAPRLSQWTKPGNIRMYIHTDTHLHLRGICNLYMYTLTSIYVYIYVDIRLIVIVHLLSDLKNNWHFFFLQFSWMEGVDFSVFDRKFASWPVNRENVQVYFMEVIYPWN